MMREAIMTLAGMEDSTERARLSTQLFGRAGTELEPLLNSGADGIQDLMDRAHELGLVMSDEAVTAGVVFGDTLADVKDSLGMVATQVGVSVMPMIQTLLDWVIAHMPEIQAAVEIAMDGIKAGIEALQAFWEKHGKTITSITDFVFSTVTDIVSYAMDVLGEVIEVAMDLLEGNWSDAWNGFLEILSGLGEKLYSIGTEVFGYLWEGLKSVWSSIGDWVSEKVDWLVDKLTFWDNGTKQMAYAGAGGGTYSAYSAGATGNTTATQNINLSVNLDGQQLARLQYNQNKAEAARHGTNYVNK